MLWYGMIWYDVIAMLIVMVMAKNNTIKMTKRVKHAI